MDVEIKIKLLKIFILGKTVLKIIVVTINQNLRKKLILFEHIFKNNNWNWAQVQKLRPPSHSI